MPHAADASLHSAGRGGTCSSRSMATSSCCCCCPANTKPGCAAVHARWPACAWWSCGHRLPLQPVARVDQLIRVHRPHVGPHAMRPGPKLCVYVAKLSPRLPAIRQRQHFSCKGWSCRCYNQGCELSIRPIERRGSKARWWPLMNLHAHLGQSLSITGFLPPHIYPATNTSQRILLRFVCNATKCSDT